MSDHVEKHGDVTVRYSAPSTPEERAALARQRVEPVNRWSIRYWSNVFWCWFFYGHEWEAVIRGFEKPVASRLAGFHYSAELQLDCRRCQRRNIVHLCEWKYRRYI